jgi:diguanylate cyclase (GGDEF)-like protein/PAS domain S-box-containing protein
LLARGYRQSSRAGRPQTRLLLLGFAVPLGTNAIYLLGLTVMDWTPLGFSVTGLAVARSAFRHHLLDIAPVARSLVFEKMGDAVIVLDGERKVVDFNAAAGRVLAGEPREPLGRRIDEVLGGALGKLDPELGQLTRTVQLGNDPSRDSFELRFSPLPAREGAPMGGTLILRNLTARKRTESLLAGQKTVLEAVARGASRDQAFLDIVSFIQQQSPGTLCAIMLRDEEGTRLRVAAAPNLPPSFREAVDGLVIGPSSASCGTAAHRGEQVISSDIATDPLWADYRDRIASAHGFRACWSTPILSTERTVLGTFAMYYPEPRSPDAFDLELIEVSAHLACIAIERGQAENALRKSEGTNRALIEFLPDLIFRFSRNGDFLDCHDPRGQGLYLPREAFLGRNIAAVFPANISSAFFRCVEEAFRTGEIQQFEYPLLIHGVTIEYEARIVACGEDDVLSLVRDITERKRVERASARLTAILQATPDLVATIEAAGAVCYLNPAGRKMLGISEDEDLSRFTVAGLLPSSAHELVRRDAIPIALRSGFWNGESAIVTRGGWEIPVSMVMVKHDAARDEPVLLSIVARDISERKRFEAQLIHLAGQDPLTGLPNRRRFQEELERELAKSRRHGTRGAVLFVDLDDFKHVNDDFGHQAGDDLLVGVAQALRSQLRRSDVLARLGGDEFAVLLEYAEEPQAQTVARAISQVLERVEIRGLPIAGVRGSIGIAFFPEQGTSVEEVLSRADAAMYEAKKAGGNRTAVYVPATARQAAIESRVRAARTCDALEKDLFVLHAQPILNLSADRIEGYELLLRMVDETNHLVPPKAFLDAAERSGSIQAIERWVVSQAINVLAELDDTGACLSLSVNLSRKAFSDPELIPLVERRLAQASLDPSRLIFEITETVAIGEIAQAQRFAAAMKQMGCRFSLDDFGVGLSSLYHLKHLPVDFLKIDGAFVRHLRRNKVDQHLVKAMVEVSRALEKKTVAEFVTDAPTLELVRACGVDYAQGFYVGKPRPVSELTAVDGNARRRAFA